jgi:hypothetical protein
MGLERAFGNEGFGNEDGTAEKSRHYSTGRPREKQQKGRWAARPISETFWNPRARRGV